jgi:hypothetical protein
VDAATDFKGDEPVALLVVSFAKGLAEASEKPPGEVQPVDSIMLEPVIVSARANLQIFLDIFTTSPRHCCRVFWVKGQFKINRMRELTVIPSLAIGSIKSKLQLEPMTAFAIRTKKVTPHGKVTFREFNSCRFPLVVQPANGVQRLARTADH